MTDWFSDLLFWIIFGAILFLLRRQKIFWTVGALALLLLFNQFFTPGFFHIQLLDGHFYYSGEIPRVTSFETGRQDHLCRLNNEEDYIVLTSTSSSSS